MTGAAGEVDDADFDVNVSVPQPELIALQLGTPGGHGHRDDCFSAPEALLVSQHHVPGAPLRPTTTSKTFYSTIDGVTQIAQQDVTTTNGVLNFARRWSGRRAKCLQTQLSIT